MDQPINIDGWQVVYAALVALNTLELLLLKCMARRDKKADAERAVLLDYVRTQMGEQYVRDSFEDARNRRGNGRMS